ncbi:VIT1/CCC1 transporter family protein [Tersicoccus mangrovi]|uniref:VIT1/CCC1 transporter family protein n=1 Tax=Tersicoccus mangrovi TaxID=3121635 RepID=UPI003A7F5D84
MPNRASHPSDHVSRSDRLPTAGATAQDVRRWRRYLAEERAEGALYRDLAARRQGEERDILLGLSTAEQRHADHWAGLLGDRAGRTVRPSLRSRLLGFLARHLGLVFVLALVQNAEARSPYESDKHATDTMAADEKVHGEVVRALATRGRAKLSGSFRAAVFGMNDGLVSNLALIMGIGATGVENGVVLATGVAGLLAGALSMAAGEYVSVKSQRELLLASRPTQVTLEAAPYLDIDANELELVYRARGMSAEDAQHRAAERLGAHACDCDPSRSAHPAHLPTEDLQALGSAWSAATSSFFLFATGALIPILPYLIGLTGLAALVSAAVLVGLALLVTGSITGLLSGASPLLRGLRQLAIGYGAALVTYVLGLLFGAAGI